MNPTRKKQLRGIAHHLQPVVTVGDAGVSPAVVAETDRALTDHELIKVKIAGAERAEREQLGDDLASAVGADVVQRIGRIVVLYRHNPDAKPTLSNLIRAGSDRRRA